jgi:hypothetical protein
LAALNTRGQLPDLSIISGFLRQGDVDHPALDDQDDPISLPE